ncbi:hypothetical protein CH063_01616 [Colletotrichum higginsianum]|uniref:Uncharacterized protein n=1 Tax=Colletotrichum higginsianum (strain IMI 349063) TaxID=759273 RepID=H1V9X1_COLHI|nr:hypothetical protein CH063_01616 [Colletotrichum higginsianum]
MTYASSHPCNQRIRREEKKKKLRTQTRVFGLACPTGLHFTPQIAYALLSHPSSPLAVAPFSPVNDKPQPAGSRAPPPGSCASSRLDERLVLSCLARLPRHHVRSRDIVGLWGPPMWRRPYDVRQNFASWFIIS